MSLQREQLQPAKLSARKAADGRMLYSQVVVVEGGRRLIFVAGQIARDVDGNLVGRGDMRAQIEKVGKNIEDCLEAAGATLADIVKTTTYVTDIEEYFKHTDARLRYFGTAIPTSTTVEVRRLAGPDYMVEIEALAIVG
jgi:enamine deaminase RidA (YjgF/YER057c/UK114 family)